MNDINAGWQCRAVKEQRGYQGGSYYGMPAVKPSPFEWETSAYLFVGGLAGAAQILATVADVAGGPAMRPVVRNGRYIALGGTVVGAALLIADLKTPRRWYNMLRIFRRTSPMSIGTYVLASFGAASGITAIATALPLESVARITQWPAALSGVAMTTYTGALLSATSNPLWATEYKTLSARLGIGAMASGAAALSLIETLRGRDGNARKLDRYALIAVGADSVLTYAAQQRHRIEGVGESVREPRGRALQFASGVLAIGVPVACAIAARMRGPAPALSILASVGVLTGAALKRWHHLTAGNESARRPEEYLRYADGPHLRTRQTAAPSHSPETPRRLEHGVPL
jgi:protein NrfD